MRRKFGKMLLVGYLICQSIGTIQAQTLIMDGKQVEYNLPTISLYVNQQKVQTQVMDPIQLNNRVLVPAREVFEAMGATVGWDNILKKSTIQYKNQTIVLTMNDTNATINGTQVSMDVPGKIINDKVMIPIRFVSEAMGMNVEWDSNNYAVRIDEKSSNNSTSTGTSQKTKVIDVLTNETSTQYTATIVGQSALGSVNVMTQTDKVIIDIAGSICQLNPSMIPDYNTYVKSIRTSQFTSDTTRVVLDLLEEVQVTTSYSADRTSYIVTLTKKKAPAINDNQGSVNDGAGIDNGATSQGMNYSASSRPSITLSGVATNLIKVTDDYRNKTLTFDLGADYSSILPNTTLTPNDAYISSISVTNAGTTKVTVVTKTVYTYNIGQSNGSAVLQLVRPKEKYNQIIVLDIGHGGSDCGAVGNGLTEKEINYNQGMALYRLLEADPNIKVYMTRESDVYPTLQFRSALANEIDADLFVSIHNNSASATVTGTETLYFPSTADPRGKEIAQLVQTSIVNNCNMVNRGIKARSDLYVLRTTNMPAILIETGFISNANEAALINSSSFISTWAQSVYSAIVEGFKIL